jgi:hypothetical protein
MRIRDEGSAIRDQGSGISHDDLPQFPHPEQVLHTREDGAACALDFRPPPGVTGANDEGAAVELDGRRPRQLRAHGELPRKRSSGRGWRLPADELADYPAGEILNPNHGVSLPACCNAPAERSRAWRKRGPRVRPTGRVPARGIATLFRRSLYFGAPYFRIRSGHGIVRAQLLDAPECVRDARAACAGTSGRPARQAFVAAAPHSSPLGRRVQAARRATLTAPVFERSRVRTIMT